MKVIYSIFMLLLISVAINVLVSMDKENIQGNRKYTGSTGSGSDNNEVRDTESSMQNLQIKENSQFQSLKIEEISNDHLIAKHPDDALEYFKQNLKNKNQFKGFLANISYDLGEIGHDYRPQNFNKAAVAYLLAFYYDENGENLDLRSFLNEIDVLNNLSINHNFMEDTKLIEEGLRKRGY